MVREQGALELPAPVKRGPGRPKGSRNQGTEDFHRWLQASYPGMTPAQQSAIVALVTPKEVRAAGGSVLKAMAVKAKELATLLEIKTAEAWRMMSVERAQLLAFAHPKLAQVDVTSKGQQLLPLIIMPDQQDQGFQQVIEGEAFEVSRLEVSQAEEP
jgi:hypothetical protein